MFVIFSSWIYWGLSNAIQNIYLWFIPPKSDISVRLFFHTKERRIIFCQVFEWSSYFYFILYINFLCFWPQSVFIVLKCDCKHSSMSCNTTLYFCNKPNWTELNWIESLNLRAPPLHIQGTIRIRHPYLLSHHFHMDMNTNYESWRTKQSKALGDFLQEFYSLFMLHP